MSGSFFEPDSKRRKLLHDISLTDEVLGQPSDENDEKLEPMSYKDVIDTDYKECYACEHLHATALEENENYRKMMLMYTENAANICKDAIYESIHKFYQNVVVKDLEEQFEEGDPPIKDWTKESIREHFEYHTNYPTDEILFQSRLNKALRNKLADNIVKVRSDGTMQFDLKSLDLLIKLDKMILELLKTKKDINTMVGYSKDLDY